MPASRIAQRSAALVALLLWAPIVSASRPRSIDCDKAQAIRPGWTTKQVTRAMGKPYIIRFSRGEMAYGWTTEDGKDTLDVTFEVATGKLDARTATAVAGSCGGMPIASERASAPAAADIEVPGVPRRIEFGGTAFYLGYVAESADRALRYVEYVPQGQSLATWHRMVAVFLHTDGGTPGSKLEQARQVAVQTRNPHFKQVHVSPTGDEAVAAFPMLRDDSVEYQVPRWRTVPGGLLATVHFSRNYPSDGVALDAYIATEEANIPGYLAGLRALPSILPPELGSAGSLTLTRDGKESGEVLVPAALPAGQAPGPQGR